MIFFVVPRNQTFTINDYLELWGRELARRMEVICYEELFHRDRLSPGTYIFSALDQLSPAGVDLVDHLWDQLERTQKVRLLNHPRRTLQRYDLLRTLYQKGRNRFQAARACEKPASYCFPVFLRQESKHTGSLSGLIQNQAELDRALGQAMIDGHSLRELLVVEYCDTSDAAGMFRKYSAFVVGKQIIPRSLTFSHDWVVKFGTAVISEQMVLEEREYVKQKPHQTQLKEVFQLANIEYGRIDYGFVGDELQTWEINLNPTIGRGLRQSSGRIPEELQPLRLTAKKHFYQRFQAALEMIDSQAGSHEAIFITAHPKILRRLKSEARRQRYITVRHALFQAIKRSLHPLRAFWKPAMGSMYPFLVRLRRWLG